MGVVATEIIDVYIYLTTTGYMYMNNNRWGSFLRIQYYKFVTYSNRKNSLSFVFLPKKCKTYNNCKIKFYKFSLTGSHATSPTAWLAQRWRCVARQSVGWTWRDGTGRWPVRRCAVPCQHGPTTPSSPSPARSAFTAPASSGYKDILLKLKVVMIYSMAEF